MRVAVKEREVRQEGEGEGGEKGGTKSGVSVLEGTWA